MIEQWDNLLRLISIGSALTLIAMVSAGEMRLSIRVPLTAMLVGLTGTLLHSSALVSSNGPFAPWLDLIAHSTALWFWLFGRGVFAHEPASRIILIAAAVIVLGWFVANFVPVAGLAGLALLHIATLLLIADLVRVGVFERGDDGSQERQFLRLWLPILGAVLAGQVLAMDLLELVFAMNSRGSVVPLINACTTLIILLCASLTLFRKNDALLSEQSGEEWLHRLDRSADKPELHDSAAATKVGTDQTGSL